ncbi:uncharacterized protein ACBR49_011580 isoform 2-T2 [Aulostomus maculatus]
MAQKNPVGFRPRSVLGSTRCIRSREQVGLEMPFLGIILLMSRHLTQAFPAPVDAVIVQVQQWVVEGTPQVLEQVLLNGVSYTGPSQEVNSILQTMSADSLTLILMSVNQMEVQKNHTVLRSRECILEGSEVYSRDRVFYDGSVYLTLDNSDAWTAHTPQAVALIKLWHQAVQHTGTEMTHLQERCINLMREFRVLEEQSDSGIPLPEFLIPAIAVWIFIICTLISIFLAKNKGELPHWRCYWLSHSLP